MDVLGHSARREILALLRDGELSAGEIADRLNRPRPGVSHHLALLAEEHLVTRRLDGAFRYYRIDLEATLLAWDAHLQESGLDRKSETAA